MKNTCVSFLCLMVIFLGACKKTDTGGVYSQNSSFERRETLVIPGEDEEIDAEWVKKGKVLVAYSDCYECHKEDAKSKGPSFEDIARRYPLQRVYLDHLARKIISGGSGAWGYPVMDAHPHVDFEEAKMMAAYVLSLERKQKKY